MINQIQKKEKEEKENIVRFSYALVTLSPTLLTQRIQPYGLQHEGHAISTARTDLSIR
jgi:hypothetical protein